jgi:hypothetical protein
VALEHLRRGNATGVALQTTKARARIAQAAPDDPLTIVAQAWIDAVVAMDPGAREEAWPVP